MLATKVGMILARGATWGQPVDNFSCNLAWSLHELTSVGTYVGPFEATYIYTRAREYAKH